MRDFVESPWPMIVAAGILWIAAPVWYLLCEAIAASAFAGYDYARFYISDLGVPEHAAFQGRELASTLPQVANAGFIGAGLLFFLGLVLLGPSMSRGIRTPAVLLLGAAHTVGIVLVGLVPGSPTNVENGLMIWHVLGAVLAIVGGNLAAVLSAGPLRDLPWAGVRRAGPVLGVVGLICAALLTLHGALPDGVWERGAVYAFYLWQLVIGVALVIAGRRRP